MDEKSLPYADEPAKQWVLPARTYHSKPLRLHRVAAVVSNINEYSIDARTVCGKVGTYRLLRDTADNCSDKCKSCLMLLW